MYDYDVKEENRLSDSYRPNDLVATIVGENYSVIFLSPSASIRCTRWSLSNISSLHSDSGTCSCCYDYLLEVNKSDHTSNESHVQILIKLDNEYFHSYSWCISCLMTVSVLFVLYGIHRKMIAIAWCGSFWRCNLVHGKAISGNNCGQILLSPLPNLATINTQFRLPNCKNNHSCLLVFCLSCMASIGR